MNWLKNLGTGFIVGKILKGIAEGKYGAGPAWLYGHLNGLITIIGVAIFALGWAIGKAEAYGLCAVAAQHFVWVNCAAWAITVSGWSKGIGVFITWIGTVNGGVKLDPPDPKKLAEAIASLKK